MEGCTLIENGPGLQSGGVLCVGKGGGALFIARGSLTMTQCYLAGNRHFMASLPQPSPTPIFTALLSCAFLGEPWRVPEIMATIAATFGVLLVFKPAFIFGGSDRALLSDDLGSSSMYNITSGGGGGGGGGGGTHSDSLGVVYALIGALGAAGACELLLFMHACIHSNRL